jgi:glycerol-3-phosphate dehydrogenase
MKRDTQALQSREHDLLVIGGGIAGAWTAWEAASRGLSVALVELEDFGQATSWASLKTAHGGLRHLQRLDISGFRESVLERRTLLRVAPEIVRPLAFTVAASGGFEQAKYFLGGLANDLLSFDRNEGLRDDRFVGPSRLLGAVEAATLRGPVPASGGAFVWHDAQITHTERLLISLLHAATEAGALALNHCRVLGGERTASGFEFKATDLAEGTELSIRCRAVVNAAGAGLEAVAKLMGETCGSPALIRGVNLVLGRDLTPQVALGARDRGRFLFLVPWLGRTMLGTVYDDGRRDLAELVRELVEAGRRAFPWAEIQDGDIKALQSGHVPGASDGEPIYRSRLIGHADPRILSILTAKYTTARATAEAAIDRLAGAFSRPPTRSISATTVLSRAMPLSGSLPDRIRLVQETEMALNREDAVRGRLIEGAFGEGAP